MSPKLSDIFDLQTAPLFYQSAREIAGDHTNPFTQQMLLAWEKLQLSGIYCVAGRPTVYFKEVSDESPAIADLQLSLWNQGIAPLLVLSGPVSVWIISGMTRPVKAQDQERLIVNQVNAAVDALYLKRFINSVETGAIFCEHPTKFNQNQTVDRYLVANLQELARQLFTLLHKQDKGIQLDAVHRFLCRIIFICYLDDRGLLGSDYYGNLGIEARRISQLFDADPMLIPGKLIALFEQLRCDFNGNLFEDQHSMLSLLSETAINLFRRFFKGEDLGSDQMSLFFWPYQFEMIPTETISTIYESFLNAEESQKKSGAYYTPYFFAEMVWDFALEHTAENLSEITLLDPACCSGIFLVIAFNRMAQSYRAYNPDAEFQERADHLLNLLKNKIYGVDINPTACKITCFSLYLALLGQFETQEVTLLRATGWKLPSINIHSSDFFAWGGPFKFDWIIGNPPWVSRKKPSKAVSTWMDKKGDQLALQKSECKAVFFPQQQLAHLFMWKVLDHLHPQGAGCLVLDSGVFLNNTSEFQHHWLQAANVTKVLQVCDWRHLLFHNAKAPACVICFDTNDIRHKQIAYIAPQFNRRDPRAGVINIDARDIKSMRRSQLLEMAEQGHANQYWKKRMRGTSRDQELLDYLMELPKLSSLIASGRWHKGQGINRGRNSVDQRDEPWWSTDRLFLDANCEFNVFLRPNQLKPVGNQLGDRVVRSRKSSKHIFEPPMILCNQGFSKFAYCDIPILFQDAIQSIAGPSEDASYLVWAMMVLSSKLSKYFHFHLAANIGVERPKVHFDEVMSTPFFLPETSKSGSRQAEIIDHAYNLFENFRSDTTLSLSSKGWPEKYASDIEPLIYEYYELQKRHIPLIEDVANVYEPSMTPTSFTKRIPSLACPNLADRKSYVETFCASFAELARGSSYVYSGECMVARPLNLALVKIFRGDQRHPFKDTEDEGLFMDAFHRLQSLTDTSNGRLIYRRRIHHFDAHTLTMLLPLELAHWTRTAAMNDADEMARTILLGGRVR